MPIVSSNFRASGLFKDAHFSTIYSAKIRRVKGVKQSRERFELPDGDFIDIDWTNARVSRKNQKVAVLFHGLEGDAQRPYMLGTAKLLSTNGYDVAAVNLRGCSGVQNRLYRSYHSGETGDIAFIVETLVKRKYEKIGLYGVSLGGNAILKYLGEHTNIPAEVKVASCIGVPADLRMSLEQLSKKENVIYRTSFLVHLRAKYRKKMSRFPEKMSRQSYKKINSLQSFDDIYTAPAHGFEDALDYYAKASSAQFIKNIKVPTLILNAKNDSFLHGDCYPIEQAKQSDILHLEMPDHGGHVGFYMKGEYYYNELRTFDFFKNYIE
nr:alpha/beta hydrolase, peptidase S33 family [uncultured bacterium]